MSTFADLGVCRELCLAAEKIGWQEPTAIQKEAIPRGLAGHDVIGLAETGSGKTGAFAIPVVQKLLEAPQRLVFCLTMAPTRELVIQISESFAGIGAEIGIKVCSLVGGLDFHTQQLALAKNPHVVVGAPGRLEDHLQRTKGFHLRAIKFLILDEADRMLSQDFDNSLEKILAVCPEESRQTFLFSATMTSKVTKLSKACQKEAVKCEVSSNTQMAENLVQHLLIVPEVHKMAYFIGIMSLFQEYSVMVFVETCVTAQKLAHILRSCGFPSAVCMHGQMTQAQRLGSLNRFRSNVGDLGNSSGILVATDVASRGLDIPNIDMVINYDMPSTGKSYIHRCGRTARAGKSGRALSMVTQYNIEAIQRVEHMLGYKLEVFTELTEDVAMTYKGQVDQACRHCEAEVKEYLHLQKEDLKKNPGKKRKSAVLPNNARPKKKIR